MKDRQSVGAKLFASLIVFVLVFGLTELFLRLAGFETFVENRMFVLNRALDYPEVFDKDSELFWRLKPNQNISSNFFEDLTISINSQGLRNNEIDTTNSKKRILAIGNSCTFGWGLPRKTIFTDQLSWRLGSEFEMINAGIPGYSSYQGKKFFASDLAELKPHLLLIMFGWNDHWAAASEIADKDQQFPSETIINLQNNLGRLHLYRLFRKGWLNLLERDPDSTYDRSSPVYRVSLNDFAVNLREICNRAKSIGTTPILMTSPIPSMAGYYPKGMRSPMHRMHEQYNDQTRRVADELGLLLIDLAREFDKHESLWDDPLNDPIHFNAQGHILAGMIIANELKRAKLLEAKISDPKLNLVN